MTTLDVGIAALRSGLTALRAAADRGYEFYDRTRATLKGVMPKGLYARALLIIRPLIHCLRSARTRV
jgi:hypothetical protein